MSAAMKLSEAIRKGAQEYPQCRGRRFVMRDDRLACDAIGAAVCALNVKPYPCIIDGRITALLHAQWPELGHQCTPPRYEPSECTLFNAIDFLNDSLKWSREEIAAWLSQMGL